MSKTLLNRFAMLWLAVMASGSLMAQIPSNYYNDANGKTGDELKVALHDIIKGHTSIYYSQIWNAFWSTDNKGNGVVWDMYSDIPNGPPPYTFSMGQNQCGEYTQEGDCYNREHSWPQSWFSGDDQATPTRDLHHVFPTDGFVNSQRSNYPYGEVQSATWTSQNGSKLGTCKSSLGYNGIVFEPIDEYKGDFARALMYMSVRYYTEDDNWGTSDMTNKSEILPWAIAMLLDWSDADPVSQKEIDRNNVIYSDYQNNRNPFIDHPEYARMIWDPNWHGGGSVGAGDYVKVTSSDEITDGNYLIVCESNNVAFDGALTTLDVVGNTIGVTITDGVIASSDATDAANFTITAKTGGGYSIKSASGYYIGQNSDANGLASSTTTVYANSISLNGTDIDIVSSGGAYLRYNATSGQTRFRYYKSSTYTGQQAIQLYKKAEAYSINLASVEHGSISANAEEAVKGATITLTANPETGYELDAWIVTDASNNPVEVANNQFIMPASNVTVSATFVYVGVFSQQYYLVTSTDQLVAGRTYLIVNTSAGKALSTTQNNNNRAATDVTISNGVINTISNSVCELTLGGTTSAWTFFDANWGDNGGYLYAASSSANNLKTQASNNNNGQWSITIASDGTATIEAKGTNTRNNLRYNPNNNNPVFSCYASSSTMAKVELYIRSEEYEHTESETIAQLFSFDKHTVHSGATLTVSGTASCDDATHLVLEDGAQLMHSTEGVQATLKKTITAWSGDGGWYTIAAPFESLAPSTDNGLIANDYDLYEYVESGPMEWHNYKPNGNFNLVANKGYLYANNTSKSLRMAGELKPGNYNPTIDLSYANSEENLKGWSLLGNPTAHEITFSKTQDVSDGYYYLNNSENWEYEPSNTVPVGRGFLVKANAIGQTVTLNSQSKGRGEEKGQYLCLGIGDEKAYVKLNEGVSMPLIDLKGHHATLYLMRDNKPYAMLVRNGAAAVDLCFEPQRSGDYTLTIPSQSLNLDYLHLIDHLTGVDIPVCKGGQRGLNQPFTYTFQSSISDYPNRFQLVFSPNSTSGEGEAIFAYYNGSEWSITNTGEVILQVIDMMGRIVSSKTLHGYASLNTDGLSTGIYMMRLINGENVKVQKIVVR